ncbi:MAG: hypothetical protein ACTSXQ_00045 [Alphaproteobacteria bacterium]
MVLLGRRLEISNFFWLITIATSFFGAIGAVIYFGSENIYTLVTERPLQVIAVCSIILTSSIVPLCIAKGWAALSRRNNYIDEFDV